MGAEKSGSILKVVKLPNGLTGTSENESGNEIENLRIIARKGIFLLGDTNRGFMFQLEDSEQRRKGRVYLTEGWEIIGRERVGRRLIVRGDEPFKSKVCSFLNFLERDKKWRDTFVCWQGIMVIVDFLIQRLIPIYEIVSFKKK